MTAPGERFGWLHARVVVERFGEATVLAPDGTVLATFYAHPVHAPDPEGEARTLIFALRALRPRDPSE